MKRSVLMIFIAISIVILIMTISGCSLFKPLKYTVSGYVKTSDGTPVSGVKISLSGGYSSVFTDSNGHWSKDGLSGSVFVTPSREGWEFSPSSTTVSNARSDVNFVGTLALKWKYKTGDHISSSPAIDKDGTIYIGSDDGYLHAIRPDGTPKWEYETGTWGRSSPAIGEDGTIYIGSGCSLYAINPDGTLKWKYKTGDVEYSSSAIGKDGTIYVGGNDGYLHAIRPDGTPKWKYETGGCLLYTSPSPRDS